MAVKVKIPTQLRSVVGGGLGLLGGGLVTAGLVRGGSGALVLSVAGSALLAAAVIGLAPVYLPPVFRGVARLLQASRPSVRLAAANTVRNSGKAALAFWRVALSFALCASSAPVT